MDKLDTSKIIGYEDSDPSSLLDDIYRNDELLKELDSLGISKEEIPSYAIILTDYLADKRACSKCHGLNECSSSSTHYRMKLEIGSSGRLTYSYELCPFARRMTNLMSNFHIKDYDEEYSNLSLGALKSKRNAEIIKRIKPALPKTSLTRWVYLVGEEGSGKTQILAALSNDYAAKGAHIAFLNTSKRFEELKGMAIKKPDDFQEEIKTLSNIDILILDGFGSEFKSDYIRDTILFPLLSARSKKRLLTFFGSDFHLNEIEALYSGRASGSQILAKRLANLIKKNLPNGEEVEVVPGLENFIK